MSPKRSRLRAIEIAREFIRKNGIAVQSLDECHVVDRGTEWSIGFTEMPRSDGAVFDPSGVIVTVDKTTGEASLFPTL